jgi:hypothetical protein
VSGKFGFAGLEWAGTDTDRDETKANKTQIQPAFMMKETFTPLPRLEN